MPDYKYKMCKDASSRKDAKKYCTRKQMLRKMSRFLGKDYDAKKWNVSIMRNGKKINKYSIKDMQNYIIRMKAGTLAKG